MSNYIYTLFISIHTFKSHKYHYKLCYSLAIYIFYVPSLKMSTWLKIQIQKILTVRDNSENKNAWVKILRTVILTIYSSKEAYNMLILLFYFFFTSSVSSLESKLNLISWQTAPKRGRTTKTQLRLSKGATNTPTSVRDLKIT